MWKSDNFFTYLNFDEICFGVFKSQIPKCPDQSETLPYFLDPTLPRSPSNKVIIYFSSIGSPCISELQIWSCFSGRGNHSSQGLLQFITSSNLKINNKFSQQIIYKNLTICWFPVLILLSNIWFWSDIPPRAVITGRPGKISP